MQGAKKARMRDTPLHLKATWGKCHLTWVLKADVKADKERGVYANIQHLWEWLRIEYSYNKSYFRKMVGELGREQSTIATTTTFCFMVDTKEFHCFGFLFYVLFCFAVVFFIFFNVSLFLKGRHRQSMSGGGAESEGDTASEAGSRLWAVSTQPVMGLKLPNRDIITWAKVGRLTNWAIQTPLLFFFFFKYKQCLIINEVSHRLASREQE